jgi:hypothetical protein
MLKRACLAVSLALCFAAAASAQTDYILEVQSTANVNALASQYQLTILKTWTSGTGLGYKVSAAAPLSAIQVAGLRATTGVTDFETDATVDNSESDPTSKAAVTLQTLGAWAFDPAPVNYYGASVRTGYVNQPAAQIIELSGSRALASTGSGIVAIIDTDVDPSHPALARC